MTVILEQGVVMSCEPAVAERDFPVGATDAELLRSLVNFAILAPSGHNTQPWLFKIRERSLDLLADRTRALPVVDHHDRALTTSCGAALEHLLVAARRFGRDLVIEELPGSDADLLARVRLADDVTPSTDDLAMFRAVPDRRTPERNTATGCSPLRCAKLAASSQPQEAPN